MIREAAAAYRPLSCDEAQGGLLGRPYKTRFTRCLPLDWRGRCHGKETRQLLVCNLIHGRCQILCRYMYMYLKSCLNLISRIPPTTDQRHLYNREARTCDLLGILMSLICLIWVRNVLYYECTWHLSERERDKHVIWVSGPIWKRATCTVQKQNKRP